MGNLVRDILQVLGQDTFARRLMLALLAGIRLAPFLLVAFGIAFRAVPTITRLGVWALLSLFVATSLPVASAPSLSVQAIPLVLRELGVACVVGVMLWLPMLAVTDSGRLLDTIRGDRGELALLFGEQGTLLAQLFSLSALWSFFALSGPRRLVANVLHSYTVAPVALTVPSAAQFFAYVGATFAGALGLVLPVLVVILVAETTLGIASRAASGLSVHFVAMPARQMLVLSVIVLIYPLLLSGILSMVARALFAA